MKLTTSIYVLFILLNSCEGQTGAPDYLQIQIPTVEMETDYVWRTLQDIPFFEQNNYNVSLPQYGLIDTLKQKARTNSLTDTDYEALATLMQDSVYQRSDYEQGYEKVAAELASLNQMVQELTTTSYNWPFTTFEVYPVTLTLYGPGGSYNPGEGSILLYTTTDGRFKQYENPANTIIHEIVHIGIESSIVGQYNVPHTLKERIVDQFVLLSFGDYLPEYRVQNMGENRPDRHLQSKDDLLELTAIVERMLAEE